MSTWQQALERGSELSEALRAELRELERELTALMRPLNTLAERDDAPAWVQPLLQIMDAPWLLLSPLTQSLGRLSRACGLLRADAAELERVQPERVAQLTASLVQAQEAAVAAVKAAVEEVRAHPRLGPAKALAAAPRPVQLATLGERATALTRREADRCRELSAALLELLSAPASEAALRPGVRLDRARDALARASEDLSLSE